MRWASITKRKVTVIGSSQTAATASLPLMSTQFLTLVNSSDGVLPMEALTTTSPYINVHGQWVMKSLHQSVTSSYVTSGGIGSNCSSGDIDSDFCRFRVAVDVYAVLALCLFGIAANVLSIVILGRDQSVRSTTRYLLQMLAVSDALYLLACLGYQTLGSLEECTAWGIWALNDAWTHAKSPVYTWASVTQTVTVWTVVIVTADRYVAITRPLQAPRYSTMTYARRAVILAWLLAVLYNIPRFFERHVVEVKDTFPANSNHSDGDTIVSCKVTRWTWLRTDVIYVTVYDSALFFLLRFLLPLSSLAFFNTRLIQAIRTSDSIKKTSSSSSSSAAAAARLSTAAGKKLRYNSSLAATSFGDSGAGDCASSAVQALVVSTCYGCMPTRARESADGSTRRHTKMLIVVVVVFFACELPDFLLRVYMSVYAVLTALDASYEQHYIAHVRPALRYANVVSNFMLTVNSCSNFVIYILIGRKFRTILFYMVLGKRRASSIIEAPVHI